MHPPSVAAATQASLTDHATDRQTSHWAPPAQNTLDSKVRL